MLKGKYIVLEGLEGAGKSTAMKIISSLLDEQGISHISLREPGGTPIAEKIRNILKETHQEALCRESELLLMYAARAQIIREKIIPALTKGVWVVADRFEWSSFAYQAWGRGIDIKVLELLSSLCVGTIRPDLICYLDISPEQGLKRAALRSSKDRIESESIEFFKRVQKGYQSLVANATNCRVIDAHLSLDQVKQALCQAVEPLLA